MKQTLRISQQLTITPQLHQAIKVLQLPKLELEQYLRQQMMENPVLDEKDYGQEEPLVNIETTAEDLFQQQLNDNQQTTQPPKDLDWEVLARHQEAMLNEDTATRLGKDSSRLSSSISKEAIDYDQVITFNQSLSDYLKSQVSLMKIDDLQRKLVEQLIGHLNQKGFLDQSIEDLCQLLNIDHKKLSQALKILQKCDPCGVGAKDVMECLELQMKDIDSYDPNVIEMITTCSTQLHRRNYQKIAKKLKISLEDVHKAVAIIAQLDPDPARGFNYEHNPYISVDVFVYQHAGKWVIISNEDGLPRLKLSNYYQKLADNLVTDKANASSNINNKKKQKDNNDFNGKHLNKNINKDQTKFKDKQYINEQIRSAKWLIKSLHQRQSTIVRVSEVIIEKQREFFEKGSHFLKPMVLKDIADHLSIHPSTVSRVTSGKYMHTPRGIFELRYFFSSTLLSPSPSPNFNNQETDNFSSESVKHLIKQLFVQEDPRRPLSDQNVVDLLNERGMKVARRTIAKYREQLGIKSSAHRKRFCG